MGEEQPDLSYPGPWRGAAVGAVNTKRIDCFLVERRPATPCVVIDLDIVRAKYRALRALFPTARIFYAVKAKPAVEVIAAERFSFGNTVKRYAEIAHAHTEGIRLFAFDSIGELEKLSRAGCAGLLPSSGRRQRCRMATHPQIRLCSGNGRRSPPRGARAWYAGRRRVVPRRVAAN